MYRPAHGHPPTAIYMLLAGPFLLPRGAGVRGARKFFNWLRRKGPVEGARAHGCCCREATEGRALSRIWQRLRPTPLRRALKPIHPPTYRRRRRPTRHPAVPAAALPCAADEAEESSSDFFVALLVGPGSPAIGQTVRESGLQEVDGLTLVSVK